LKNSHFQQNIDDITTWLIFAAEPGQLWFASSAGVEYLS